MGHSRGEGGSVSGAGRDEGGSFPSPPSSSSILVGKRGGEGGKGD